MKVHSIARKPITWTPNCPDVNGSNEKELWIHVELLTAKEQYKHQSLTEFKSRSPKSKSRLREIQLIIAKLIKNNALFITFCDAITKHTHLILLWVDWIKLSPFLKQNVEWGDKYEYYQEDWTTFKSWCR